MAEEQDNAAQEKFTEGVNSGNFDVFEEVVAPDVVDHDPVPEQGPGPRDFGDMFATMRSAYPDLVALACTIAGTHQGEFLGVAPTGKKIPAREVRIGRFEDGRLAERRGSSDQLAILQQLGAGPETGRDKSLVDKIRDTMSGH